MMLNSGLSLVEAIPEMNSREGVHITVDDISGLLKHYFRDLLYPLFPPDLVEILCQEPSDKTTVKSMCGTESVVAYRETQLNVKSVVNRKLSKIRRATLDTLCGFLYEVACNCEVNKMTPHNLALVFAPNLAHGKPAVSHAWKEVVSVMIGCYPFVFGTIINTPFM